MGLRHVIPTILSAGNNQKRAKYLVEASGLKMLAVEDFDVAARTVSGINATPPLANRGVQLVVASFPGSLPSSCFSTASHIIIHVDSERRIRRNLVLVFVSQLKLTKGLVNHN